MMIVQLVGEKHTDDYVEFNLRLMHGDSHTKYHTHFDANNNSIWFFL